MRVGESNDNGGQVVERELALLLQQILVVVQEALGYLVRPLDRPVQRPNPERAVAQCPGVPGLLQPDQHFVDRLLTRLDEQAYRHRPREGFQQDGNTDGPGYLGHRLSEVVRRTTKAAGHPLPRHLAELYLARQLGTGGGILLCRGLTSESVGQEVRIFGLGLELVGCLLHISTFIHGK